MVNVPRKPFISHVKNQVSSFVQTSVVDIFYFIKYCFVVIVVDVLENLPNLGALITKFTIYLISKNKLSQGRKY